MTEKARKKRGVPWITGIAVLFLFVLLFLLQSSNLWKNLSIETSSDLVLLYGLSALNFFALVIFGFILLRSIVKLIRERKALVLGSQIKTRLFLYFILVSILPIFAMATFSYLFMNRALERWFTQIPENVIRETRDLQTRTVIDRFAKLDETTRMLATLISEDKVSGEEFLAIARAGNLSFIGILKKDGKYAANYRRPMPAEQTQRLDELLAKVSPAGGSDIPEASDGREFDLARARLPNGSSLIVVPDEYSETSVSQIVDNSLTEFEQLKQKQITIRQVGLLTLGVLTFLLIFASSWIAFYIARGITQPIKALAIGADEIAHGNLSHRVEVLAEDELGMLVDAFNAMSEKLEQNAGELAARRRYIEAVLEALPTGVISFGGDGRLSTVNQAAARMFHIEGKDATGKLPLDILFPEHNEIVTRLITRARRTGFASEQAVFDQASNDNGSNEMVVSLAASPLPDNSGTVLVAEDLSELIAAQRASAWQEVARRMAHEIKNPLTPIQLSAERIAKRFSSEKLNDLAVKGTLDSVVHESTETILREVFSLKMMVDEFSRFARLPEPVIVQGSLSDVIRRAIASFEGRSPGVEIAFSEIGEIPEIMLDDEQMKRVFTNIIENSLESFSVEQTARSINVTARHDKARGLVVTEVVDNGRGIELRDLPRLFQPYFSTKGRGTGLGLAIVNRIVAEHKGRIFASANDGKGAKFTIELPAILDA
ncbi:MAG: HAMP domain-containing protein [Acidobacteria bacterium]|nr:HAMP domain-containing protein [Acidobacteriota bacterium]